MTDIEKERRMTEVVKAMAAGEIDLAVKLYSDIIFDLIGKVIFESKNPYEYSYGSILEQHNSLEGDDNAD